MAGIVTLESETQVLGTVGTRPAPVPAVPLRRIVAAGTTFDEAGSASEVLDRLDRALGELLDIGLVGAETTLGDPLVDDAVRSWCPATADRHGPADVALPVTVGDRQLG